MALSADHFAAVRDTQKQHVGPWETGADMFNDGHHPVSVEAIVLRSFDGHIQAVLDHDQVVGAYALQCLAARYVQVFQRQTGITSQSKIVHHHSTVIL